MAEIKTVVMQGDRINLAAELRELNSQYLKLNAPDAPLPMDLAEVERHDEDLIKSAQLVADYYNNDFLKRYASSGDKKILDVGYELQVVATTALTCIRDKRYFGLGVLLIDKGSKITDPNNLEKLARSLGR